jgi:hypothetical protein
MASRLQRAESDGWARLDMGKTGGGSYEWPTPEY